jgi:hypothetical protein
MCSMVWDLDWVVDMVLIEEDLDGNERRCGVRCFEDRMRSGNESCVVLRHNIVCTGNDGDRDSGWVT